jgi:putative transposase
LLDIHPKIGVFNVVNKIKGYTSKVLREEFGSLKRRLPCLWTRTKFISSVGSVSLEVVKKYIELQKSK